MRAPRGGMEQFYFLCHNQRPELRGEALNKIDVRKHGDPVRTPIGVIIEFPKVDELIDRARVALEVANEFLVLTASLERREAKLLIQLHGFRHLADVERVGPKLVECHVSP